MHGGGSLSLQRLRSRSASWALHVYIARAFFWQSGRERYPEIHTSTVVAISKDTARSRDLWKGTDLMWRLQGSIPVYKRLLPSVSVVSVQRSAVRSIDT
jgi:hypothetical protein